MLSRDGHLSLRWVFVAFHKDVGVASPPRRHVSLPTLPGKMLAVPESRLTGS